ncbi:MAG: FtsX-like permease family protein [Acidimicrobiales bacterium]
METKRGTPASAYRRLLNELKHPGRYPLSGNSTGPQIYWSTSPARYRVTGPRHLAAIATTNPLSIWDAPVYGLAYRPAPPGEAGTQFRRVAHHPGNNNAFPGTNLFRTPLLRAVGLFDPDKLPGFSPLSRVPLESYYPPEVVGATPRDKALLGHRPLGPSMNLGGYLSQPPLLLTTLKAAQAFQEPDRYSGGHPKAPISSVRVRVADVHGDGARSRARIEEVASAIARETGLLVQITAGSSPTPIEVSLPAGSHGRPALTISQGWVQEGAVTHLVNAVDAKSAALFALILVVAALFLSSSTTAAVRARRQELATLSALGWSPADLARAVLVEVVVVGGGAGILGVGLAALLVFALGLSLPLYEALLAIPVSLALALAASIWPMRFVARLEPTAGLSPPVSSAGRHRARRAWHLAWSGVARRPGWAFLGALGLSLGVAATTVVLGIELAFRGDVVATLLGSAAVLQVRTPDLAAACLAAGLGAVSVADVLVLDLAERAGEWATLSASGWSRSSLLHLGALQGLLLGAVGSACGGAVGFAVASALTGSPLALIAPAVIAVVGGLVLTALALVVPLLLLARLDPLPVLARE